MVSFRAYISRNYQQRRLLSLCRGIRDLINNTVEIEYKLALARAGKVQLGQSRLCIADRLRALHWQNPSATTAAPFSLDALPYIPLPDGVFPHWPDVTDGFIPYLTDNHLDLVLWRPILSPGPRGAREERRSIPAIMSHLSDSPRVPPAVMGAVAVDVAQDLLVFSRPARPEIAPPECYVYSLSEGGPHPEAAGPHPFRIAFDPVKSYDAGFGIIEDLQIFGDVVAWSITDDGHSAVHVWNWKTSVLVWYHQSRARGSCCRVISPGLVVLVTAQSLSVYQFDSSASVGHSPQPASLGTALCVLELPRLNASRFAPYVRAYMQFPPSAAAPVTRPDTSASVTFELDPIQTVLAVTLLQSTDVDPEFRLDPEDRTVSERYAIFVPLPTLFKFARVRVSLNTRRRTVPWARWGPAGTRIVRFQYISHISVMGSRCAFMLHDHHAGTLHTVLFDVRCGVSEGDDTTIRREHPLDNVDDGLVDVSEVLAKNLSFAEEVRTTFPVEVVHKRQVFVTHPAVGYKGYDPVYWL
ncbi:hypothetical protein GSI_03580 [Ganoderma sinense ZZ0214-1]|uniref:F-box domain-containing protein n=1 Tax=Ganoderma sinense ZZ0214-1 TaxID=1077348 RepID=A0A2G8SJB5_9APHY|nr:hypothetical protein GSI_03580 [Ganoderma sinense ZZ0214-1]